MNRTVLGKGEYCGRRERRRRVGHEIDRTVLSNNSNSCQNPVPLLGKRPHPIDNDPSIQPSMKSRELRTRQQRFRSVITNSKTNTNSTADLSSKSPTRPTMISNIEKKAAANNFESERDLSKHLQGNTTIAGTAQICAHLEPTSGYDDIPSLAAAEQFNDYTDLAYNDEEVNPTEPGALHALLDKLQDKTLRSESESENELEQPTDNNHPEDSLLEEEEEENVENSTEEYTPVSSDDDILTIHKQCLKALRLVSNWNRLFSFLCVTGAIRFTARQYKILAAAIMTVSNGAEKLRTYKTIRSTQWTFIEEYLFPKSSIIYISGNNRRIHRSRTKRTISSSNNGKQDPRECVRLVLPSEWAKLDLLTSPIFNNIYNLSSSKKLCIENTPLSSNNLKQKYVSGRCSLWARYKNTVLPTDLDDIIQMQCGPLNVNEAGSITKDEWISRISSTSTSAGSDVLIKGRIGSSWCVRSKHTTDENKFTDISLDESEQSLFNISNKATHTFEDLDRILQKTKKATTATRYPLSNSSVKGGARWRGRGRYRSANNLTGGRLRSEKNQQHNHSNPKNTVNDRSEELPIKYETLFLFPGDICIVIKPPIGVDSDYIGLLIASFVWRERGRVGERCIWMKKTAAAGNIVRSGSISVPLWTQILDMPKLLDTHQPKSMQDFESNVGNRGVLDDGTPYFVYRFLLYADGFKMKKTMKNSKSVYGVYIMPVGLSQDCRNSCTAARVITLAAHGQDINEVMEKIVDDIVEGSLKGIETYDIYGDRVQVFLDPSAIIGDYLAAAANTDVAGHTADAFCSFCVIIRRKGGAHPEILFTNKLHSRRPSLTRFDERMDIVRTENITPAIKRHIGISCSTNEEAWQLIAVKLARRMKEIESEVRKNDKGDKILDVTFDSHLSAAACPDHLFNGLIENVLTVCFTVLSDDEKRRTIDTTACKYIQDNHLPSIDSVLNWDKHGRFKGLNNLTTSGLFCALLYCAPLLKRLHCIDPKAAADPFHLPQQLQDIISLVYFWPSDKADTADDFIYVSGEHGSRPLRYYGDIQKSCENYLESIKIYYLKGGRLASILDKPNAHRLLELAMHTIPMFKHGRNVSELVLEMVHRVFKEWLQNNPNHDAHISAVEIALARDWSARLYALVTIWQNSSHEMEKKAAYTGLKRLLLGAAALQIPENTPSFKDLLDQFKRSLNDAFRDPVLTQMKGHSRVTFLPVVNELWIADREIESTDIRQELVEGMRLLTNHLNIMNPETEHDIRNYAAANFCKVEQYSEPRRTSMHTTIFVGDVVTAIINGSTETSYLAAATTGQGKRRFFEVYGIIGIDSRVWLVVKDLKRICAKDTFIIDGSGSIQILRLTVGVRRGSAVHACTEHCRVVFNGLQIEVVHDEREKKYHVLTAATGFPPQMG